MADARSDIVERYAAAFFELARLLGWALPGHGTLPDGVWANAQHGALALWVAAPVFDADTKKAGFTAVLDKSGAQPLTKNFVALLAQNGRLSVLADVITAFRRLAADHRGEVSAETTSARALTPEQTKDLRAQIEASVGKALNLES